jgi:hypothetical protein
LHNREEYSGTVIGFAICRRIVKDRMKYKWVKYKLDKN